MSNFVYFIKSGATGSIKIGVSKDPLRRLADLQNASGEELELIGVIKGNRNREKALHERFAHGNVRGEWFTPSDDLMREIQDLLKSEAVPHDMFEATVLKSGGDSEYAKKCARMVRKMVDGMQYMKVHERFGLFTRYGLSPKTIGSLYYRDPSFVTVATYFAVLKAYRVKLEEDLQEQARQIAESAEELSEIDKTLSETDDGD